MIAPSRDRAPRGGHYLGMLRCADMSVLRWVLGGCAVLAVSAPAVASAAGEACLRDTACVGAERCIEGVCTADASVQSCTDDDDCSDSAEVCADGFCKIEGVVCSNPAGTCWVEDGGGRCDCGDGESSGWSDGFNPDDPPAPKTDEELQALCTESLVDSCGTDAPALPDSCVGEVLDHCQAFVDHHDAILQSCGEDVPEVDIARVGACCDEVDDDEYAQYRECILAIELGDACPGEAFDACEGAVGGEQDGEGDPASAEDDDDDTEKSGCRIDGAGSGWCLLALFAAATWRRRSGRTR
jgi:hypothetical protein